MGQQPFPVTGSSDDEPVAGAGQPVQSAAPLELEPDARAMVAAGRLIPSESPAPRQTAGPPDPESSARRHPRSLSALVRSTEDRNPLAPAKMQLGPLSTPRGARVRNDGAAHRLARPDEPVQRQDHDRLMQRLPVGAAGTEGPASRKPRTSRPGICQSRSVQWCRA